MSVSIEHIESPNGTVIRLLKYSEIIFEEPDHILFEQAELERFQSFKSAKRKSEYYYTRLLWREFGISETIQYNEFGRPFLKKGYISISHSRDVVVIAYNLNHPVGVDVEYHSPKLRKIQNKFLSSRDRLKCDTSKDHILTTIWSIKEAVYKMECIEGLSFREHIHVSIFENEASVDVVKGKEQHQYTFEMKEFGDFVLTFCSHADLNGTTLF